MNINNVKRVLRALQHWAINEHALDIVHEDALMQVFYVFEYPLSSEPEKESAKYTVNFQCGYLQSWVDTLAIELNLPLLRSEDKEMDEDAADCETGNLAGLLDQYIHAARGLLSREEDSAIFPKPLYPMGE
jgi:hypothetical protein